MRSGGEVFEWPAYATGWKIPQLDQFFRANGFHDAIFHGCALGLKDQGRPVNKPWRIRTTCKHLSDAMSKHVCDCPPGAHAPCQGAVTSKSENYTPEMAKAVVEAVIHAHAGNMQTQKGGVPQNGKALLSQLKCNIASDDALDTSYATPPSEDVRGLDATFSEGGLLPPPLAKVTGPNISFQIPTSWAW